MAADSPIAPGDLVMFTRSCCDRYPIRLVFTVFSLEHEQGPYGCKLCGQSLAEFSVWATDGPALENQLVPLPWLKKIEPLMDAEVRGEQEESKA